MRNKPTSPFFGRLLFLAGLAAIQGCGGGGSSSSSITQPSTVTLKPKAASVPANGTVLFTVGATGAAVGRQKVLSVEEIGGGAIDGTGYRAPAVPGVYHLKCTARYNPAIQATCEVTVVPN